MGCGCTSACGCNIVAGAGILATRIGDKITISSKVAIGDPTFIQTDDPGDLGYSYVWYEVDGLGALVDTHVVWVAP